MNKTELINEIADEASLSKKQAGEALEAAINGITKAIARGGDVRIAGVGTFSVTARGEQQGRNPRTGEAMTIAAKKHPKFKPAKALLDEVNGK